MNKVVLRVILAFLLVSNSVIATEHSAQGEQVHGSLKSFIEKMERDSEEDVYFSDLTREEIIERLLELPKYATVTVSDPIEMEENVTVYSMNCGNTEFGIMFKPDAPSGATIAFFPLEDDPDFDDWFNAMSFIIQAVDPALTSYEAYQCALFSYEDASCTKNGIQYATSSNLILSITNAE